MSDARGEVGPGRPRPGWYLDPASDRSLRYWNGTIWTAHTAEHPVPTQPSSSSISPPPARISPLDQTLGSAGQAQIATPSPQAPQGVHATARTPHRWVTIAAVVVAVVSVSALAVTNRPSSDSDPADAAPDVASPTSEVQTDDPQDVQEFCGLITEWTEVQRTLARPDLETYERGSQLTRSVDLFSEVPAAAPDSVRDDMFVIVNTPYDSPVITDSDARSAAVERVDGYVAEQCDLRFSFGQVDFTE